MPKISVDFYANRVKGLAPCRVQFYPMLEIEYVEWQDTTDATEYLYQCDAEVGTTYQDWEGVVNG